MLIATLVCFILALIGIKKEHTFFNLQTIFCLLWGIMSYAASLRLYEMNSFSEDVYLIVCLGCIGFSLGYFSISSPVLKKLDGSTFSKTYIIDIKWFNIFFWIGFVFMIYFTIKTIGLLMAGVPYYNIRTFFGRFGMEDSMLTSKFELYIQVFVLNAIVPVFLAMVVLHLLKIIVLSKTQLIRITLLVLTYTFVSGSRITITNAIMQLVILYFMFHLCLRKRTVRRMAVVLIILVMGISLISDGRNKSGTQEGKYYTYYTYATVAFPMLDHYKEIADKKNDRTYGAMYTYGLTNCIVRPLSLLGLPRPSFLELPDKYGEMIDEYINIFTHGSVNNAYVTTFFYFYLDFGWPGVFLLSMFFGWLLKWSFVLAVRKRNLRVMLIFAILLVSFTKSFMRWEFVNTHYVLSFLYIVLLTKKNHGLSTVH